ncbi:hypothetical protein QYF61_017776 [Mycteria americana]|uniref:Integrase catalytic domain-containing protein n=1 Tax=Mycteria americana TaxID=33587 RepID=A0AAN7MQW0_MYCAM|nr:hypothetical protein QYF61_017776 [Mycteria americana]
MVEATTGWLETYPVPHATARNTILGLEKQVLQRHGTPERIESDNGTHFQNNLIDTWAKEHGIEWLQVELGEPVDSCRSRDWCGREAEEEGREEAKLQPLCLCSKLPGQLHPQPFWHGLFLCHETFSSSNC